LRTCRLPSLPSRRQLCSRGITNVDFPPCAERQRLPPPPTTPGPHLDPRRGAEPALCWDPTVGIH
jgi:hypothetical protein